MRREVVAALIAAAGLLVATTAMADSRISFEVGGVAAYSPITGASGLEIGRRNNGLSSTGTSSTDGTIVFKNPGASIVGVDVRPTFFLAGGWRFGVGFRAGKAFSVGNAANRETSLLGGDVSFGYGRFFGRFAPYAELRFGFNSFEGIGISSTGHREQLRLDGVIGARVYLGQAFYLLGTAFAGVGDRYGGSLALGLDLVHYRWRGRLP